MIDNKNEISKVKQGIHEKIIKIKIISKKQKQPLEVFYKKEVCLKSASGLQVY